MGRELVGGSSSFANGLSTGIRMLLVEENRYVCEHDLVHALRTRLNDTDDQVAREAASIAWAITWLHPLALGFFVFGLCADRNWFLDSDSDDYVSRLLRITPNDHARQALKLYEKYQANEADGGAAVIRGFGIESLADFDDQVFGYA